MMDKKQIEKCLQEVKLLQSVNHPNIVKYLDSFVHENELYIAIEWAEKGDLKRYIRKLIQEKDYLDELKVFDFVRQIASALQHMHEKRIIHRDLKPANILVFSDGRIKLGDLGLGRFLSVETIKAFSKVGTPLYMSPELIRQTGYDFKTDVWSLGCVCYELILLKSPFISDNKLSLFDLFTKIEKGDYPKITDNRLSNDIKSLVEKMLAVSPEERISLPEVVTQIDYILNNIEDKPKIDPFIVMEDILEKLKLIDYEVNYCKKLKKEVITRYSFACNVLGKPNTPGLLSFEKSSLMNNSFQFISFYDLCTWLIFIIKNEIRISMLGRIDVPNKIFEKKRNVDLMLNDLMASLKSIGIKILESAKLSNGFGEGVCLIITQLLDRYLITENYVFGKPVYDFFLDNNRNSNKSKGQNKDNKNNGIYGDNKRVGTSNGLSNNNANCSINGIKRNNSKSFSNKKNPLNNDSNKQINTNINNYSNSNNNNYKRNIYTSSGIKKETDLFSNNQTNNNNNNNVEFLEDNGNICIPEIGIDLEIIEEDIKDNNINESKITSNNKVHKVTLKSRVKVNNTKNTLYSNDDKNIDHNNNNNNNKRCLIDKALSESQERNKINSATSNYTKETSYTDRKENINTMNIIYYDSNSNRNIINEEFCYKNPMFTDINEDVWAIEVENVSNNLEAYERYLYSNSNKNKIDDYEYNLNQINNFIDNIRSTINKNNTIGLLGDINNNIDYYSSRIKVKENYLNKIEYNNLHSNSNNSNNEILNKLLQLKQEKALSLKQQEQLVLIQQNINNKEIELADFNEKEKLLNKRICKLEKYFNTNNINNNENKLKLKQKIEKINKEINYFNLKTELCNNHLISIRKYLDDEEKRNKNTEFYQLFEIKNSSNTLNEDLFNELL